jgi:predicted transcriptional regulator
MQVEAKMAETTITIHVDEELTMAFEEAAKARNRTGAELLQEFMQEIVFQSPDAAYDQWFRRQVQIGIDEADRGELISSEEVEAEFAALRAGLQDNLLRTA